MTETQAQAGAVGTSATPVEDESASGGASATGRAAVGRAVVPADAPAPKFTRAPGMAPPPDEPSADGTGPSEPEAPPAGTAAVPVVRSKGKKGAQPAAAAAAGAPSAAPAGADSTTPRAGGGTGPSAAARAGAGTPVRGTSGPNPSVRGGPVGAPTRGVTGPATKAAQQAGAAAGTAAVGAARVTDTVRAARATASSAAARGPRRARLNLKRIDPWSVMKFSFAVSVVLFIVVVVATSVLYLALDAMGVWEEINKNLSSFINASGGASTGFRVQAWGVIGSSMLIGAVNVVLFTALATLGAFIYNVCADLVGGVELTLAERD